jgi:hypothetical protein
MTIKINLIEGLHLTVTERRHIGQLLEAGASIAASKQKTYRAERLTDDTYRVAIESKERDSQNRPAVRTHVVTARVSA